jgi:hypothetical protein
MSQPRFKPLRDISKVSVFFVMLLCSFPFASCQNGTISNLRDTPVGWQAGADSSGTWDIVSNCLATIIACTWSVQHLNVPCPRTSDGPWYRRWRSVKWMVITILFPEFLVLHVMFELVMAVKALKHMKEKGKKSVKNPWWLSLLQFPSNLFIGICSLRRHFRRATLSSCHSRSEKDSEAQVADDNNERPDAQDGKEARIWTLTLICQHGRNSLSQQGLIFSSTAFSGTLL